MVTRAEAEQISQRVLKASTFPECRVVIRAEEVAYTRFAFKADHLKVNVSAYTSGKVVVAGKGTEDFVRDVIEPEVTGAAKLGYDEVLHPDWFESGCSTSS